MAHSELTNRPAVSWHERGCRGRSEEDVGSFKTLVTTVGASSEIPQDVKILKLKISKIGYFEWLTQSLLIDLLYPGIREVVEEGLRKT